MIDLKLEIKVDQFNACMNEMASRLQGSATKKEIIRSEVQSILQKTINSVKVGSVAKIVASQAGTQWTTMAGKKYKLSNRYPDALWGVIKATREKDMAIRIASIGWGARAWYELALLLGLTLTAKEASTAVEPGRDAAAYVKAAVEDAGNVYKIQVTNNSRLQTWIGGAAAFFSAIAGRVGFFNQNLKHGVFNDMKQVAAKYPGIEVNSD
jgi:uncharacterized membrane protein